MPDRVHGDESRYMTCGCELSLGGRRLALIQSRLASQMCRAKAQWDVCFPPFDVVCYICSAYTRSHPENNALSLVLPPSRLSAHHRCVVMAHATTDIGHVLCVRAHMPAALPACGAGHMIHE